MNKPKALCLHFRLRTDTLSTYRPINLRVRVAGEKNYTACSTGICVELGVWRPYKRQSYRPHIPRNEAVEAKLDAVWQRVQAIYAQQLERSTGEGWRVTGRTIVQQYRGLPLTAKPHPRTTTRAVGQTLPFNQAREGRHYV